MFTNTRSMHASAPLRRREKELLVIAVAIPAPAQVCNAASKIDKTTSIIVSKEGG